MPHKKRKNRLKVQGESIAVPTIIAVVLLVILVACIIQGSNLTEISNLENPVADATPTVSAPAYVEAHYPQNSKEPAVSTSATIPFESVASFDNEPLESIDPASGNSVSPDLSTYTYSIDTIAANIVNFRSMIMRNSGAVYYIDGNTIHNTENTTVLDLYSSFGANLTNPYLAYDSYNDIVYLLAGKSLVIYDITDFNSPSFVLDVNNCPTLAQEVISRGELANTSSVTPQIPVLENGALLVPLEGGTTYMVDPTSKSATRTTRIYLRSGTEKNMVLGNSILNLTEGSRSATVVSIGEDAGYSITLDIGAPTFNANSVISRNKLVYYYDNSFGVCTISIDGSSNLLIPQDTIEVKDNQKLSTTNIWSLDTNESGEIAFYDNSLKCIRKISPI